MNGDNEKFFLCCLERSTFVGVGMNIIEKFYKPIINQNTYALYLWSSSQRTRYISPFEVVLSFSRQRQMKRNSALLNLFYTVKYTEKIKLMRYIILIHILVANLRLQNSFKQEHFYNYYRRSLLLMKHPV